MSAAAVSQTTTFFTRLSHVHAQFPVAQAASVEHIDGFLRLCLIAHFHKCKSLRPVRLAVHDQRHRSYSTRLDEQVRNSFSVVEHDKFPIYNLEFILLLMTPAIRGCQIKNQVVDDLE